VCQRTLNTRPEVGAYLTLPVLFFLGFSMLLMMVLIASALHGFLFLMTVSL